jgi:hypothetical protein
LYKSEDSFYWRKTWEKKSELLFDTLKGVALQKLELRGSGLQSPKPLISLMSSSPNFKHICISDCYFPISKNKQLLRYFSQTTRIESIEMVGCSIGLCPNEIADLLKRKNITSLSIPRNVFSDYSVLEKYLPGNTTLKALDIVQNLISFSQFISILFMNTTLTHANLRFSKPDKEQSQNIGNLLKMSKNLKSLELYFPDIDGIDYICDGIKSNTTLRKIILSGISCAIISYICVVRQFPVDPEVLNRASDAIKNNFCLTKGYANGSKEFALDLKEETGLNTGNIIGFFNLCIVFHDYLFFPQNFHNIKQAHEILELLCCLWYHVDGSRIVPFEVEELLLNFLFVEFTRFEFDEPYRQRGLEKLARAFHSIRSW